MQWKNCSNNKETEHIRKHRSYTGFRMIFNLGVYKNHEDTDVSYAISNEIHRIRNSNDNHKRKSQYQIYKRDNTIFEKLRLTRQRLIIEGVNLPCDNSVRKAYYKRIVCLIYHDKIISNLTIRPVITNVQESLMINLNVTLN